MRVWILDDLHGKEIYHVLKELLPGYTYPIKKDILDPLPYLDKIKDGDLILLDNYFDGWEGPLGNDFLGEYLKRDLKCRIVAISDFGEQLTEMFENWNKANKKGVIIGWVKSKKGKDIYDFLRNL